MIIKPMLAATLPSNLNVIPFPVLATPKLDGIRCLLVDGMAVTRNFKLLPNLYTREMLELNCPDGLDGEVVLLDETGKRCKPFNEISSAVMSHHGKPTFTYMAFDFVPEGHTVPYYERMNQLRYLSLPPWVVKLLPIEIRNIKDLLSYEQECLDLGYEGIMLRTPDSPYKAGRSTLNQFWLVKMKRFVDAEAEIVGFEEKLTNMNEAELSELGYSKRSSHKAGMVPTGTLGALTVQDLESGIIFNVGSGFNDSVRQIIWDNQDEYLGQIITYKSQPHGEKDKPRFPVFKGFRRD